MARKSSQTGDHTNQSMMRGRGRDWNSSGRKVRKQQTTLPVLVIQEKSCLTVFSV
jgi:hypothetical protein